MKKISYYLILVVGTALIAYWVYSRYVKEEAPQLLLFKVERGDLSEVVKVRGEVAPQKEFDLEFPFFFHGTLSTPLADCRRARFRRS